jgi:deoxyadenosine/deoxycytidine kinase
MKQPTKHAPRVLIVEGNIGAGKSTLLRLIAEKLSVDVVYEPHTSWQSIGGENLLEKFYNDGKRWAYTFQTYAFITRLIGQAKAAEQSKAAVQVVERSVYSDRYCFAKSNYELGNMSSLEWKLYQEWSSSLTDLYTSYPYGCIYLRADPQVCLDRLKKRSRHEEKDVSLDYLKLIHDKHEEWILEKKDIGQELAQIPVLVIDGNQDFENDKEFQNRVLHKIADFFTVAWHCPVYGPETVGKSCC